MPNEFEKIPECVWELFREIMWADLDFKGEPPVKCSDLAAAQVICWGWEPPLIEPGETEFLTLHGLAAYSWWKKRSPEEDYLPADTPTQCAKKISRSLPTLKTYIKKGIVRCIKVDDRLWRLHRKDVHDVGGKLE